MTYFIYVIHIAIYYYFSLESGEAVGAYMTGELLGETEIPSFAKLHNAVKLRFTLEKKLNLLVLFKIKE